MCLLPCFHRFNLVYYTGTNPFWQGKEDGYSGIIPVSSGKKPKYRKENRFSLIFFRKKRLIFICCQAFFIRPGPRCIRFPPGPSGAVPPPAHSCGQGKHPQNSFHRRHSQRQNPPDPAHRGWSLRYWRNQGSLQAYRQGKLNALVGCRQQKN